MPLWIRFRRFLVVVWQLYIPRRIQIHFQLIFWHRKRLLQRKELELIQHRTINDLKHTHRISKFSQKSLKIQTFFEKIEILKHSLHWEIPQSPSEASSLHSNPSLASLFWSSYLALTALQASPLIVVWSPWSIPLHLAQCW